MHEFIHRGKINSKNAKVVHEIAKKVKEHYKINKKGNAAQFLWINGKRGLLIKINQVKGKKYDKEKRD